MIRSKFTAYLALSSACMTFLGAAATQPAQAAIVYWNPNIFIPLTSATGLTVRLDTQEVSTGTPTGLSGWDFNITGCCRIDFLGPATTLFEAGSNGAPYGYSASSVFETKTVGPTVNPATTKITVLDSRSIPVNGSGWSRNRLNYFGFRFFNETKGIDNWAWAVVEVGNTAQQRTLVELGYDDTGATLLYGAQDPTDPPLTDQALPFTTPLADAEVPGPLPLLGAGAAFAWSRRLRRRIQNP
jgi:hypothetical protein